MKKKVKGDFDDLNADYPECTQFVTADVTLDLQEATQVSGLIQPYGKTSNNQQRYLLTVWDSGVPQPKPRSIQISLGPQEIVNKKARKSAAKKK
ncbi:MAG: hypothetical protein JST16_11645 [Bdellovibrionales bacterium]|nr:hypothetical protein [Bdellovibrionales bacterium]